MSDDVRHRFDGLVEALETPLVVVTVAAGDRTGGCLVSFHTQISLRPPRYLVALSPPNRTARLARDATTLAMHTIPADRRDLAELFGGRTGDRIDKLARCQWQPWDDGTPVLLDAASWMVGRIRSWTPMGDHDGVVLDPVALSAPPSVSLLTTGILGPLTPGHPV